MKFWDDLKLFQRTFHKSIPMFINTTQGAHEDVWPSFFDNQLRNNSREIRRNRIQVAFPNRSDHISLFVKHVAYEAFRDAVNSLLEESMYVGPPGDDWQSVQVKVPRISVFESVERQAENLDEVFRAAKRLYDFFIRYEKELLAIPVIRKK